MQFTHVGIWSDCSFGKWEDSFFSLTPRFQHGINGVTIDMDKFVSEVSVTRAITFRNDNGSNFDKAMTLVLWVKGDRTLLHMIPHGPGRTELHSTPTSFAWHIEHNCTLDESVRTAYTQTFHCLLRAITITSDNCTDMPRAINNRSDNTVRQC
jgi:hypothetical protein